MKIWLVDDHQLFRAGFRTLLSRLKGVEVEFEANDGVEFMERLKQGQPDLVFMDIAMPRMNGIETTQKALELVPDLKIVVISMFGEREYYDKLVDLGVKGFLLKSCDFQEVEMAISAVESGDYYFSQELMQQMSKPKDSKSSLLIEDELSAREKEILVEICKGASNQEIGDKLFISKRTVEKHRANLLLKTGSSNTASLVVFAVKNGLFTV